MPILGAILLNNTDAQNKVPRLSKDGELLLFDTPTSSGNQVYHRP